MNQSNIQNSESQSRLSVSIDRAKKLLEENNFRVFTEEELTQYMQKFILENRASLGNLLGVKPNHESN
jgi:hypothetical protein